MLKGQLRIVLEALRGGETVSGPQMVQMLYGHCAGGGPQDPADVVHTLVRRLRQRLAPLEIDVVAVGKTRALDGYCIEPEHLLRLSQVVPIE